ncbi:hypothetical protein [Shimazuella alba]|jgi:hypothetical protein|uniref:Uncharacterized protein n=1 Tax=Shimazuella alba TaxID=2690964 RepID=A0A6I4VZZ3_9BACL|nr:hypothetical protein [Shimazuella alba]MXQ54014.1 hypothetical protein [Shimazuella alba]
MISLNEQETAIVILALTKVIEDEQSYIRVDEYKKVLDRLKTDDRYDYVPTHLHLLHERDEF